HAAFRCSEVEARRNTFSRGSRPDAQDSSGFTTTVVGGLRRHVAAFASQIVSFRTELNFGPREAKAGTCLRSPKSHYHTSTGPFGTGIWSRCATAGACIKEATSGSG